MMFNYNSKTTAKGFRFYHIPQALFTNKQFSKLSAEAKILYGLLLERMSTSSKTDAEDKAYIFFTLDEVQEYMGIGKDKAIKLFSELDMHKGIGLIERKKQGQGKPMKIYVMDFLSEVKTSDNMRRDVYAEIMTGKTPISDLKEDYMRQIYQNINYDALVKKYGTEIIDEIVTLVLDTVCSEEEFVFIGYQKIPTFSIRMVFLQLKERHIDSLMECMKTANIGNRKVFILRRLYDRALKE